MDGEITIGTRLDTKSFDKQIAELEAELRDLEGQKIYFETHGMEGELKDVEVQIEKVNNKLIGLNEQKKRLNEPKGLENLGKSFESSIKKAGRLALGIFGIRSAYMALRRASSDLANYDEQYATNLEYIRYVLTQAIAPVLKTIVNLAYYLLTIIARIIKAITGKDILANASKGFKDMKSNASGTNKELKKMEKQLAGFDEINVLKEQEDSSAGAGGGGAGGDIMPDFRGTSKMVKEHCTCNFRNCGCCNCFENGT